MKLKIHGNNTLRIITICMVCLMSFCFSGEASAKKCTNMSASDNGSIYHACEMVRQGRSSRYGALWISDESSTASIKDEVNVLATSGKVNVYLHGLAICSGGGCIGSVKATYIKLIQSSRTSAICDKKYYDYSGWGALSSVPSSLTRPVINRSTTFRSGVDTMKLDIDYLKSSSLSYSTVNGKRVYNVPIHPFRCMAGFKPSTSGYCNCGSDDDPIYVKISVPDNVTLTLKANAVTRGGTALKNNCSSDSKTVAAGSSATLTVKNNNCGTDGYTFQGWRDSASSGSLTSGNSYSKTISADKTVYAVYDRNVYEGRIEVSGAANDSIGYTHSTSGSPKYVTIPNCSPTNGCKIAFADYIKRASGSGTTNYTVSRSSNYPDSVPSNSNVASGNSGNPSGEKVASDPTSGHFTLYPGMVVCEKLSFKVYSTDTNNTTISLCVVAEGDAQPSDPGDSETNDPSGDTSFINIKVKNNDVTAYNTYQRTVYAKPGDHLNYWATYNPVLQYTYSLIPETMRINSGTTYPTSGKNTSSTLGVMFNNHKTSSMGTWKNSTTVYSSGFASNISENHTYNNGDTGKKDEKNDHAVAASEAGKSLDETIATNLNSTTKTTSKQVNFKLHNGYNRATVDTGAVSKKASGIVPYNYINTTEITTKPAETTIYAGESFPVQYTYAINTKSNSKTTNDSSVKYATTIGNPKWKLRIRINDGGWIETSEKVKGGQDFSVPLDKMYTGRVGDDAIKLSTTINVPDAAAGSRLCVQSAVWPANSGSDVNLDADGNKQWAYSPEVCFVIAKKPSIQVWGGNVYTQRNIETAVTDKNSLAGYADVQYAIEGNESTHRVFGSWGELGVIASGIVKGFASGASTGYVSNNNGVLSPSELANSGAISPGGSTIAEFCNRSILTFANACTSHAVGMVGNEANSSNAQNDKQAIIDRLRSSNETTEVSGNVNLPLVPNYVHGADSLTVGCGGDCNVGEGTKMVHSNKIVKILNNIVYTGVYDRLSSAPKVVIYGENVEIDCNVTRIDALLIADNAVVTCDNLGEGTNNYYSRAKEKINEGVNSRQLRINGAVLASQLVANRTYGTATGSNSIVPAEIVNFDASLYMWGGGDDSEDQELMDISDLKMTYLHELAPRR